MSRAGFRNRQVCVVVITQLPNKARSTLEKWVQEHEEVTDNQMREFIGLVQQNLRQAETPLDYGAREVEVSRRTTVKSSLKRSRPTDTRAIPSRERRTPPFARFAYS